MNDLVSIITPCYQAEAFIERAVESVLKQTHSNWEMLVVADDGLNYEKLLQEKGIVDHRLKFLTSGGVGTGPNHTRNVALEQAQGQWIAPLDADDLYYPRRIETLIKAAMEHNGLALDNFYLVHESSKSDSVTAPKLAFNKPGANEFLLEDFLPATAPLLFVFHRSLIKAGWDEDIARSADTVFNLRALEKAEYAAFVGEALHEYRVHNQSLCHSSGAAEIFSSAYQRISDRLTSDGLGFKGAKFKGRLIDYFNEKTTVNQAFASAVQAGFKGNFQEYVQKIPQKSATVIEA